MKVWIILFLLISCSAQGQFKNLVLEGGGVRGIAYVGAIQALEENDLLKDIENIAGTSVGAISAAFICTGFTSEELLQELSSLKLQEFNDGRGIFVGGIHRTNKRYGWYKGEKLTSWIDQLLEEKTGIKNITFSQLHSLSVDNNSYKDLYVTVTNLSKQRWELISYKNYPNMRIADGVRISASIPMYYSAVFIDSTGKIYNQPPKNIRVEVLVDGGFLANYPIHVFDTDYELEETIGLRLDESIQIQQDTCGDRDLAPIEINDFRDYIGAFYNMVIENLNRCELTEEDWSRTISISTQGIGPKVKRLREDEVIQLVASGYEAVKRFLGN